MATLSGAVRQSVYFYLYHCTTRMLQDETVENQIRMYYDSLRQVWHARVNEYDAFHRSPDTAVGMLFMAIHDGERKRVGE